MTAKGTGHFEVTNGRGDDPVCPAVDANGTRLSASVRDGRC